jgi:hypothetical protein
VLETQKSKNLLLQAQRSTALRVTRCYHTVSDMAAIVLARMPPAFLQAVSRKEVMEAKRASAKPTKHEMIAEIVRQWQTLWEMTPNA